MQNTATPRVVFRKEAILRHIKREDSSVLPSFERRGELGGLWLSVVVLLGGCMALTTIPSTFAVPAVVVKSAEPSGLCLSVPYAGGELLRAPKSVAVIEDQGPVVLTGVTSVDGGCALPPAENSTRRGDLVALHISVPQEFREQAGELQPGRHVQLTARSRIWDLVRNGLTSKTGVGA